MKEKAQGAYFQFNVMDGKPLMVKVAISSVSTEGALKNLEAEQNTGILKNIKKMLNKYGIHS